MATLKDPAMLSRLPVIRETKTFTDPSAPGDEWEFTFAVQYGMASALFISETAQRYIEKYVVRGETIDIGGYDIPMSESLCNNVAMILLMDKTPNEGVKWQFGHWAGFAQRCPEAFVNVLNWGQDLQMRAMGIDPDAPKQEIDLKNGS